MSNSTRQFIYTIPENILDDESLTLADIKVYLRIRSFMDSGRTCYAHNKWFSEKCHIDQRTVTRSIANLSKKHYIVNEMIKGQRNLSIQISKLIYSENSTENTHTEDIIPINVVDTDVLGGRQECLGGVDKNVHHTISNNNRSNILSSVLVTDIDRESEQKIVTPIQTQKDFFRDYKKAETIGLQSEERKMLIDKMSIACLEDIKCNELFKSKFSGRKVQLQEIHNNCVTFYALKSPPQIVSPDKFLSWLNNEKPDKYTFNKQSAPNQQPVFISKEEQHDLEILADYRHCLKYKSLNLLNEDDYARAKMLYEQQAAFKTTFQKSAVPIRGEIKSLQELFALRG